MIRSLLLLALAACGGGKQEAQPALGSGTSLAFVIDDEASAQKPTSAAPWHADGGGYAYFGAHLASDQDATFVLGMPETFGAVGTGWLGPTSAEAGARLVADYARTFAVPAPATPVTAHPVALEVTFAVVGRNVDRSSGFTGRGSWTALALSCPTGGTVMLAFSLDEGAGVLFDAAPAADADVARCLASAVQEGAPPPRTAATDPTLATAGPTFSPGKLVARPAAQSIASHAQRFVFLDDDREHSWLSAVAPATGTVTELYRTARQINSAACSANACAVSTIDRTDGSREVVLVGAGKPVTVAVERLYAVVAVSPDGRHVIAATDEGLAAIEVATKKVTRLPQPSSYVDSFVGWTDAPGMALVARRSANAEAAATRGWWDLRSAQLAPAPNVAARALRSPDGAREITIAETGTVTVVSAGGPRTFVLNPGDRGATTPDCCTWVDNRWLLVIEELDQMWIDTEALKVSPLPHDEDFGIAAVPGTRTAVLRREDGWHLATIDPPP